MQQIVSQASDEDENRQRAKIMLVDCKKKIKPHVMTCPGYIYTEQESDVGTDVSKTQVNKRQIFNE